MLGLTRSTALQKRAIQFGTRIANKNVCGQAVLDDTVDFASVVHPDAVQPAGGGSADGVEARSGSRNTTSSTSSAANRHERHTQRRRGDASLPTALSKKRGTWASARAAPEVG